MKGSYETQKERGQTMNTRLEKRIMGGLRFARGLVSPVAVAMAFGMSGIARAGTDDAVQSCSEHMLRGSYLLATHGFNIVGVLWYRKPSLKASISMETARYQVHSPQSA
jgi:hypothetical protein